MKLGWKKLTHRKNLLTCLENGFAGSNSTEGVKAFYSEKKKVDFNNLVWNKHNGHFMNMIDKTIGSMGVGCAPNTVAVHNHKGNAITIFIHRKALKDSGILCSFSSTGGTTQIGHFLEETSL